MAKNKKPTETPQELVDENTWKLVTEITDLVKVRAALSYGTGTSQKQSAESAISRKINSKVLELSKIIIDKYND